MIGSDMDKIAVWGFRWVPPFAQGLVRDLRVRWALGEAGLAYESRLIGIEERNSDAYRRKHPFAMVPVLESGGETVIGLGIPLGAIHHLVGPHINYAAISPFEAKYLFVPPVIASVNDVAVKRTGPEASRLLPFSL